MRCCRCHALLSLMLLLLLFVLLLLVVLWQMLLVMLTAVSGVYVAWSDFFILLIRHRDEEEE